MQIIKRILDAGFKGFYRNRTISVSSIFILIITLSIICSILITKNVFSNTVEQIKSKVDISINLKRDSSEASIISIKQKLQNINEIKEVVFISKEDTLISFKEKYKNDEATLKALEEVSSNPFGASFKIVAKDTGDYSEIINKINNENILGDDKNSIDKINYVDIKDSIDRLNKLIYWFDNFGLAVIIIFSIISIMIVYNTIRLAIFTFKDEISVMKLVGASDMYIRGPFIVEAVIYAFVSSIITLISFFMITKYIDSKTVNFLAGYSVNDYFVSNIFYIFFILLISSILVAAISSILAVRKYLSV